MRQQILDFVRRLAGTKQLRESIEALTQTSATETVERALWMVRQEYTVMPRFGFHQPLDYNMDTFPPRFDDPVFVNGVELPLPPPPERMGYSDDNSEYLKWGKYDHGLLMGQIEKYLGHQEGLSILDFGCSSGRVLRHFWQQKKSYSWKLAGVDVQARPIEWMRQNFPTDFRVYVGNTLPHLPFEDNSMDVIYGFSVFTHIKYQWDAWILELRRILKPGGLLIQTIHTENAWNFYRAHKDQPGFRKSHSSTVLDGGEMNIPFFYYGDISVSQVFWKRETARQYWGRYVDVLEILPPPPEHSFQDWMICRK
jgi:SAM-dependent methyltransferase